jgi:hypothetical protein
LQEQRARSPRPQWRTTGTDTASLSATAVTATPEKGSSTTSKASSTNPFAIPPDLINRPFRDAASGHDENGTTTTKRPMPLQNRATAKTTHNLQPPTPAFRVRANSPNVSSMLTTTRPAVKNATYQPAPPPQPNKPTNATSTDATPESMAHKLAVAIEKIQALEALTKLHNRTNSQLRQEAEDQKRLHDRETKHLTAKRDQDLQRAEKEIRELRKVISDVEQDRASKNSALCDDLMEQSERDQEALREAHDKMLNLRDVLDQTQHNLRASQQACRERDAAIKVNGDSIHQLKANLAKERQNRQALEATLTQERQKRLAPIASSERLLPVEVEHLQIMVMSAKRDNDQLQEGLNKTQERKCQLECDLATSQAETERSRLEMEHILATLQASVDTQRTDIIALEDVADTNDKVISALQADRILLLCVVVLASTLIWMEKHNELGKATRQRDHWQLEAAFWKQECDILAHKCDQIEQVRGHAEATIGNLKTRHEEEKRHSDDRIAKMQQTIEDANCHRNVERRRYQHGIATCRSQPSRRGS